MPRALFEPQPPLAERLRPKRLEDFVGQGHLLGPGKILTRFLETKQLPSLIFWGPPGCGKTTLARLLARESGAEFITVSAVETGLKELRKALEQAQKARAYGRKTIIFIDEIHRFNKAQQDFLLPFVETGKITLIGATTENPSFRIVAPLLSRVQVFRLNPLSREELLLILKRALKVLASQGIEVEEGVLEVLAESAEGDARMALNFLENLAQIAEERDGKRKITRDLLQNIPLKKPLLYDREGEEHYDLLSAFHKSLRGSDPDAALYWMVRMLEAGEDPLVIIRRLVAAAAEDVGLADPRALQIALAAKEAFEFLGRPEGELALAEAVIYVALAPKSNSAYQALEAAREDVERFGAQPVPLHLRNPVTALMRRLGYGKGYVYPHHAPEGFVSQQYLPDKLKDRCYYRPKGHGLEKGLKERLYRLWPERAKKE
ncbi:MAG TPA: replication-associated recombination protein A [Thermodesulfatator atlanticus]|uniref:Replication-associated recombination protein A n=1 Tax=Thermodesulfatator atlanticus TaxID=501497 RepID=A0A7V5U1V8_9BACT|nr:replication-associated recombination protein A [Thermodesulfatator atlanticus]